MQSILSQLGSATLTPSDIRTIVYFFILYNFATNLGNISITELIKQLIKSIFFFQYSLFHLIMFQGCYSIILSHRMRLHSIHIFGRPNLFSLKFHEFVFFFFINPLLEANRVIECNVLFAGNDICSTLFLSQRNDLVIEYYMVLGLIFILQILSACPIVASIRTNKRLPRVVIEN